MPGPLVLDCSVLMSWCFDDEADAYGDAVLSSLVTREAIAPSVLPLEVGNVLLVAERTRRLRKADSDRFIELLSRLPISILPEPSGRALGEILILARRYRLSTYDASYLDLAMREGIPLATRDKALQKAARRCQVTLVAQ